MLCCKNHHHTTRLPVKVEAYYASQRAAACQSSKSPRDRLKSLREENYNTRLKMLDLLYSGSSNFVKGARAGGFELLFGNYDKPLTTKTFSTVLQWLLVVSGWKDNIGFFEKRLRELSNAAMSKPSLDTFRSIPLLRQNISDLIEAIERERSRIRGEARAAFAELQQVTHHHVESLDDVFEDLMKQASALSAKTSNEIQLVIGSVTIQLSIPPQISTTYNHISNPTYRTPTR